MRKKFWSYLAAAAMVLSVVVCPGERTSSTTVTGGRLYCTGRFQRGFGRED